jgi:DNA-directed RNA polymerase specialized sigma24 family protein
MNIDQKRMAYAFENRKEKQHMNDLVKTFYQMATCFANQMNVANELKEDYVTECVVYAVESVDKYNGDREGMTGKVTPFSFFYCIIQRYLIYIMRRDTTTKKRSSLKVCSYELILPYLDGSNVHKDAPSLTYTVEKDDGIVSIGNRLINRTLANSAAKAARKHWLKWRKDNSYAPAINDELVDYFFKFLVKERGPRKVSS